MVSRSNVLKRFGNDSLELRAVEVNLNSLIGCYKIRFDAYGVLAMRDLACI